MQCSLLKSSSIPVSSPSRTNAACPPPISQPSHIRHRQRAGLTEQLLSSAYWRQPRHVSAHAAVSSSPTPGNAPFLRVVLPTAMALMLCNMDRICLSVAIIPMSAEFGWATSLQGVIQAAFLWGYMATQLLGGTLADKYGGKVVMAWGMAWFSLASLIIPFTLTTATTAAGLTVGIMLAARCAVGLGEGVALPSMNNLVASYVPKESKARGLGMCFSGFHTGNLLGLVLSPFLLEKFGWRALFCIFGLLGAPLIAFWLAVVPKRPAPAAPAALASPTQSSVSEAQAAATTGGKAGQAAGSKVTALTLLSHSATWAIILVNVVNHWGYFIYLNWMPTYFVKALGFDLRSSSLLAFLPWLVMAVGSSASGVLADALVARGMRVITVRKVVQSVAFIIPALALIGMIQPGVSPQAAVAFMTVALGTTSLGQAGFVANMSDIAPRHAGMMFGLCNTFGSLSGIVGTTAVGYIVEATKSFSTVFQMTAALYVLGTVVWLLFAQGEKVFD